MMLCSVCVDSIYRRWRERPAGGTVSSGVFLRPPPRPRLPTLQEDDLGSISPAEAVWEAAVCGMMLTLTQP